MAKALILKGTLHMRAATSELFLKLYGSKLPSLSWLYYLQTPNKQAANEVWGAWYACSYW